MLTVHNEGGISSVNSRPDKYVDDNDPNTIKIRETNGTTGDIYMLTKSGNKRDVNKAFFHETMHLLGLSDRYDEKTSIPNKGFADDIMGSSESYRIGDTHYRDYVNYFKNVSLGTTRLEYRIDITSGQLTEPTDEDLNHKIP